MDQMQNNKQPVRCPECDTPLPISKDVAVGTIVECLACATENECINLSPLTFAPLEQEK